MMPLSNILDPIQSSLPPLIWSHPETDKPELKPHVAHFITRHIYRVLEQGGYDKPKDWVRLVLTGSLTTYQFSDQSDVDVSIFVDSDKFPEWSRSEMIGLMIEGGDGVTVPGTPYPLQCFVVARQIKPHDLYKKGLRAGYDINAGTWIEPPDHDREHDVASQENGFYTYAMQSADKMESLLRYEPDKAIDFWHQLHKRRMRDQTAGKGDFSEANIVYKFLSQRGLFPRIAEQSGEYIAKTAGLQPTPVIDPTANHQAVLDANAGQDLQGLPGTVNVPGMGPLQFHSNADIQRMAGEYNQQYGIQSQHPTDYSRVNPQMAQQVAAEFDRTPHAPYDPETKAAYTAFANETRQQYDHLTNNGYNFEFYPQGQDPYPNSPREALLDLHHNKHMYVYPTNEGFGAPGDEVATQGHHMLGDSGVRWNGQPVTHNDLFRAVHDVFGHAKEGVGFRADGEENAFRQHAAMFSPQAQRALTTETRGQNNWINHGPYGEQNQNAKTEDTIFAQNRMGLMPEWTGDPNLFRQPTVASVHTAWGEPQRNPRLEWHEDKRHRAWEDAYAEGADLQPPYEEQVAAQLGPRDWLPENLDARDAIHWGDQGARPMDYRVGYPGHDERQWMQQHHDRVYDRLMQDETQGSGDYEKWLDWYYRQLQSRGYDPFEFGRNPEPSSGTFARVGSMFQPITQAEARGNSRPVSYDEFQQLAGEGQQQYEAMKANTAPITGLEANWPAIKDQAYQEALKPWGGVTVDSHTGVPLDSSGDLYALTAKPPGMPNISLPENPHPEQFHAAMDHAKEHFRPILERAGHHLGVFHDDAENRIDIDPIMIAHSPEEVERLGAYTRALGGAYHFRTGDGYFPPHVAEPQQSHQWETSPIE